MTYREAEVQTNVVVVVFIIDYQYLQKGTRFEVRVTKSTRVN